MTQELDRTRRGRTPLPREDGVVTVGKALAPQLGSDLKVLINQEVDMRRFAVLNEQSQAALGYFEYRGDVDGIRFWGHIVNWELNTTPSIGGLARRQAIQMVNAAAGGGRGALDVAERPGWVGRHLTDRAWKERATKEGKVIVE